MIVSRDGIALLKHFEGCRLEPYVCPAGVLTVGYGSTGPHVKAGMRISEREADALLLHDLKRFEDGVEELVKVPLNQGQFDALCSFAFNLGLGALGKSTLLKKVNAKEWTAAAAEILKWNRAGGQVLPGLTKRRTAEAAMFAGLAWR